MLLSAGWRRMSRPKILFTLYSLILLSGAIFAFRRPFSWNWDALAYMDLAWLSEGKTAQQAHTAVYLQIKNTELSTLATSSKAGRKLAVSLPLFDDRLPFYSIRPGYIFLIRLANLAGFDMFDAPRVVSGIGYLGIGFLLYFWGMEYTNGILLFLWASVVMVSGVMLHLARLVTPDAISTLLVLAGLYLAIEKDRLLPGLLLLFGALFIRTDDVLIILAVLAWLTLKHRLKFYQSTVLAALGCGVVEILNKLSGNYGWKVLFNVSFMKYSAYPSAETANVSALQYLRVASHNFHVLDQSYLPLVLLMGVIAWLVKPGYKICTVLGVVGIAMAMHFVLYPTHEVRDYAPLTLISLLAMLSAFGKLKSGWLDRDDSNVYPPH